MLLKLKERDKYINSILLPCKLLVFVIYGSNYLSEGVFLKTYFWILNFGFFVAQEMSDVMVICK